MTASIGPRLVVAGTHSGVGKTTVATGLMAAMRTAGMAVASAKVGPDFIDPGYHSLATGRPPRNLDPWLCGLDAIRPLAGRAGAGADLLIVEGVMGLFDGAVDGSPSSTADVAVELDAPVVLVVDGSAMSASVAAMVRGYRDHRPELRLAGVILNRVGSDFHRTLLTEALADIGVEVLGTLGRDDRLTWRDRHLGLVPIEERPDEIAEALRLLGDAVATGCNLERIISVARSAPKIATESPPTATAGPPARIAIAGGRAFTFTYRDNLEMLESAGAELVPFDPLTSERLPDGVDGLVIGGGFPEVFAERLADNSALLDDVAERVGDGLVTWAECGGLLWLSEALDDLPMAGVVAGRGSMTERLTLGYREVTALSDNPVLAAGDSVRAHEFHYSTVEPAGEALRLSSRFGERIEGHSSATLLATYTHIHMGARPDIAERFVRTCAGTCPM